MAKSTQNETTKIIIIALLVLNILFGVYIAFIKPDAYSLETLKVWGKENMNMATQLYKSDMYKDQQKSTLEQILGSMNQGASPEQNSPEDISPLVLEDTKLQSIMQNVYIKGKKDARITLIEYSDFLCSYCRRHYTDKTLEKLVEKYPNDVNMVFKQFPVNSPLSAQASLCAGKVAGTDKYYTYIDKAFQITDFSEDSLIDLAVSLKINKSKFVSCLTNPDIAAEISTHIQEAQSFGMNGTPGNLVLDNENGNYVVIAGAYPMEAFEAEIIKMLK